MVTDGDTHIAVVGSGAAGLSAAWLLAKSHRVTLLEKDDRLGGHAHTAEIPGADGLCIDTGFIVYNEPCYPNLVAWLDEIGVATEASDMSFAVSRDNGSFEYAGGPKLGLLAQPGLLLKPRFWRMLRDLLRFYREAPDTMSDDPAETLGDFLVRNQYSGAFVHDHLLPFGAAVWSTSRTRMLDYPAMAFIRFCENHGLLKLSGRPQWRTVSNGSHSYVKAVEKAIGQENIVTNFHVDRIERQEDGVTIHARNGHHIRADHVVIATHADQALSCLDSASDLEQTLLSPFAYESNLAILHTDTRYLPKRRRAWCSWNYVEMGGGPAAPVSVSYWMNRLQNIDSDTQYVVTLNPEVPPEELTILRSQVYEHPVFTSQTWAAQQRLWSLQGQQRTWFCGSYFGAGFHEDAIQAGLAVAEQLGGKPRPWVLDNPSGRIFVRKPPVLELVAA